MLAALGVLAASLVLGSRPADAQAEPGRVLVLSLPALAWEELYQGDSPALDALLDESAVAAMSVRDVLPVTDAGDGYATVSAGSRARGALADQQVLEYDEDFYGTPAAAVFRRNTGVTATSGLVAFGFPALVRRNDRLDYDAEIGALGEALAAAAVPRAVIANADGQDLLETAVLFRTAGNALIDQHGTVPGGAVSEALLEPSPTAPYGVHLSPERVTAAFEEAWALGGVVLVEGSDLARADRFMPVAAPAHRPEVRREALRSTDAIVARLLESVDPSRDSVLVVAPYHSEAAVHLTVAGMRGPGIEPGLLRSGSTRRAGLVTLVDIAPTILDLAGVERPDSMEGRRFEPVSGGPATGIERAEYLTGIDQAARYRDQMVAPVAVTFVVLQAVLWIAAIVAIRRGAPAGRRTVALAALSLLAFLPATYLAGLVDFHASPATAYWVFVVGLAVALAVARDGRGRPDVARPVAVGARRRVRLVGRRHARSARTCS